MPASDTPLIKTNVSRALLACAVLAFALVLPRAAAAENDSVRYVFLVSRVELPKNASDELESIVRRKLAAAIASEPKLAADLPSDAPLYSESEKGRYGNKAFQKYMKKRGLQAFKVTLQVTKYEPTLVPNPKKPGQILGSSLVLRIFGETVPDRVMAFTGDGSATVMLEVGKKTRPKDRIDADSEAAELAVGKAVAMSLAKLESKPKKADKRSKRRRRRRSRK